jgi:uncharacterized protein with von Willebrand factor type A (vWA) domain
MRRLTRDIGKWSLFQGREARGLPVVADGDSGPARFEDEVFARLFEGDERLPLLPVTGRGADPIAPWGTAIHAALDAMPDFQRLAADVKGDALASAAATGALVEKLKANGQGPRKSPATPQQQAQQDAALRRVLRSGCAAAVEAAAEQREELDGISGILPGGGAGYSAVATVTEQRSIADRLATDARIKAIARLAGKFKRIASNKRKSRVKHGADEITDIEQGGNLARLLPSELMKLRHPALRMLLMRDVSEKSALQYQLTGTEPKGKGPMVVCLDKSGSMEGTPDIWATAVALALLDVCQREKRTFAMITFSGCVRSIHVVKPGEALPMDAILVHASGGTDVNTALRAALDVIHGNPGQIARADVVLIGDGASADNEITVSLRARAKAEGVSCYGVGIGCPTETLLPWCDDTRSVQVGENLDNGTADALFAQR